MKKYVNKLDFDLPPSETATGALAKLWRRYLTDNGFVGIMPMLIEEYLKRSKESEIKPIKHKNKSTMLGNVNAREMSIKTLFDLIFNLTNAKEMDLSIKVTLANGKVTNHTVKVMAENLSKKENQEVIDVINAVQSVLNNRNGSKQHSDERGKTSPTKRPT